MHDLLGATFSSHRHKNLASFLGQFSSQNNGIVAKQTYGNIPKAIIVASNVGQFLFRRIPMLKSLEFIRWNMEQNIIATGLVKS